MPIADVIHFAKSQNIPMTAVACNPSYDNTKGRVSKGATVPFAGWTSKSRFELKNIKATPNVNVDPYFWMLSIKKAGFYVIDIDVKNGHKAKDVMNDTQYEMLYLHCNYVVQTGSGGIHFYFKLPKLEDNVNIRPKIKCEDLANALLKDKDNAEVDILVHTVATEGSSYTFQNVKYEYLSIKPGAGISSVAECPEFWDSISEYILDDPVEDAEECKKELSIPVEDEEIKEHLENIPNERPNWDEWYKMGQTIYNIYSKDGFDLFNNWSKKCKYHDETKTRTLWRGLRQSNRRGIGSILYLSRQADEAQYKKIRAKYNALSYKSMKCLIEEDHFFVKEPKPIYVKKTQFGIVAYSPGSFQDLLRSERYTVKDKNGVKKNYPFYDKYVTDPSKVTYNNIGYYPDNSKCPHNIYNIYVPPLATFTVSEKNVDLLKIFEHIDIITGNTAGGSKFFIQYLAQIVQMPDTLCGMLILIYGKQGAGKDILINWFGKEVIGNHLYCPVGNPYELLSRFNNEYNGKLLLHCQEFNKGFMTKHQDDLKRLATTDSLKYEGKGKDSVTAPNYGRIIMTTNNKDALIVEDNDRRYVMFESSDSKIKDATYFKELVAVMKDKAVARAFYDYLMKVDLSDFNHLNRPKTELYNEMKQESIHPVLQWICESEEDFGIPEGETECYRKASDWLELFNNWHFKNNMQRISTTAFGTFMSTMSSKDCGIIKRTPFNVRKYVIEREKVVEYLANES